MRAYGNGTPQQCVHNLMSIVRGECPFERCKGMASDITGQPLTSVFGEMVTEVYWNINNYEPRAKAENINLIIQDYIKGKTTLSAALNTNGG